MWIVLVCVLVAGALLRGAYLLELQQRPEFQIPMLFQVDMGFIDNSALDRAQRWRARLDLPAIPPRFVRQIVWTHNPGNPQLRPPAYTFLLSALYFLLGDSPSGVRFVQMAMGLCSALLGFALGRQLFGPWCGVALAGLLTFHWPLIIYESVIHEPVLVVFCALLFLNSAVWFSRRPTVPRAVLAGLSCGLYTVAAAAVILFLPALVAWTVWTCLAYARMSLKQACCHAAVVAAAFFAPILPVTALNFYESGGFVLNSYGQGITLYIGNQPESQGYLLGGDALLDEYLGEEGAGLRVDEKVALIDSWPRWGAMARAAAFERIRNNPGWFFRLCLKRAVLFWSPYEISQNVTEYCDKRFSTTLWWVPGGFAWILPFFLLGLGVYGRMLFAYLREVARRRGAARPEPLFVGCTLVALLMGVWYAPYLVLWVSGHFRLPLLPCVFVFAALAFQHIGVHLRARNWRISGGHALVALFIAIALSLIPVNYDDDIQTWLHYRVQRYLDQDMPDEALEVVSRVVARAPQNRFARLTYADLLLQLGQPGEALAQYISALALFDKESEAVDTAETAAMLMRGFGNDDEARPLFQLVLRHRPDSFPALHGLADMAYADGDHETALSYLMRAKEVAPEKPNIDFLLGLVYSALGDPENAEAAFAEGVRIDPDDVWTRLALAEALAARGELVRAREHYEKVIALQPDNERARQALNERMPKE